MLNRVVVAHCFLLTLFGPIGFSQDMDTMSNALPYAEIPAYPESFTASNVAARSVDGLGFRYYWATEGLSEQELEHRPGETGRNSLETMAHIYVLVKVIENAVTGKPTSAAQGDTPPEGYDALRSSTLHTIASISQILKSMDDADLEKAEVIFQRGETRNAYPFWHILNGPLADATWHVGQIVLLRRAAGNPINGNLSFFSGTVKQ